MLRWSAGYTRRANSATLLDGGRADLEREIPQCEAWMHAAGIPPVFRLLSFAAPAHADELLAARGYQRLAETFVLQRELHEWSVTPNVAITAVAQACQWLDYYCELHSVDRDQHKTHERMLKAIAQPCLLATVQENDRVIACGLGVLDGAQVGLFDLVTGVAWRKRGIGAQLIAGILNWAIGHGASTAYLQVAAQNQPALHLYQKLGFQEKYQYWYRV